MSVPLFDKSDKPTAGTSRTDPTLPDVLTQLGLAQFCIYYPVDGNLGIAPPAFAGVEEIDRSRALVVPMVTPAERAALTQHYRDRTSATMGVPIYPNGKKPTDVRLAMLDTSLDSTPGSRDHAAVLVNTIQELGLNSQVEIYQEVAMPLVLEAETPEWQVRQGGDFGTTAWLAQSMARAWLYTPQNRKLVLNLSLGWEPSATLPAALRADEQSLLGVMRSARCNGALIVAASGNRRGPGIASEEFTYPAAWEAETIGQAPIGICNPKTLSIENEPVVWVAGGIAPDQAAIALARDDAMPNLVTLAQHVATKDSEPITGTSVGSAMVAAAAAQAWRTRDDQSAAQIMQLVYTSGTNIPTLTPDTNQLGTQVRWVGGLGGLVPTLATGTLTPSQVKTGKAWIPGQPLANGLPPNTTPWLTPAPSDASCPLCGITVGDGVLAVDLEEPYTVLGAKNDLTLWTTAGANSGNWDSVALGAVTGEAVFQLDPARVKKMERAALTFVWPDASGTVFLAEVALIPAP